MNPLCRLLAALPMWASPICPTPMHASEQLEPCHSVPACQPCAPSMACNAFLAEDCRDHSAPCIDPLTCAECMTLGCHQLS